MNDAPRDPDSFVPEIDLRNLPPPEPLLRAIEAADALASGDLISVLTPMYPAPLIEVLSQRGFRHVATALPGGGARIVISHPDDGPARG